MPSLTPQEIRERDEFIAKHGSGYRAPPRPMSEIEYQAHSQRNGRIFRAALRALHSLS